MCWAGVRWGGEGRTCGCVACGELALVESFSKMPYFQLGGLSNETRKREDCLAYVQRKRVPEKLCVLLKELL